MSKRNGAARIGRPRTQQVPSALDVDSTQIVNMALNLSESRRIASRRNISRPNPSRLPVQDAHSGGNLRTQLQQQLKTTRGISPQPNQVLTPRLSGVRSSSPLRGTLEPATDVSYRYHFSTSTLARAQRAREHLELMAQYRRLLDALPALKMVYDRPAAASPPGSPTDERVIKFGTAEANSLRGREYNPLQYIRNRKVRARERMTIDGEKQGFGDVETVKRWVTLASQRASTTNLFSDDEASVLPPFPGAEDVGPQVSDTTNQTALRVRRPRVDWFVEPGDLIADAYWLEQDHHKQLIEDRNWNKIYPREEIMSRPMSRQTDELGTGISPFLTKTYDEDDEAAGPQEDKLARPETGASQSSAKGRAKQKLHEIGSFHRHTGSTHSHHDFLRRRRDSSSDADSETEPKGDDKVRRPRRSGTLSSSANELLEKQMLEIIARETRQQRLSHVPETEAEYQHEGTATPDHAPLKKNLAAARWSATDPSDSDRRSFREELPQQRSSGGLNRHQGGGSQRGRHPLGDVDSPQPMSPELDPVHDPLSTMPTGLQLSAPSSRSSSPLRKPFTKVKQIFRDKTREELEDQQLGTGSSSRQLSLPEPSSPIEKPLPERQPPTSRPTHEGHRYQRSIGSVRHRDGDNVGLRGMFKGPRIDTVIRGGVSRLGDMLWKKDANEVVPEALSADESDNDVSWPRAGLSLSLSRTNSKRNRNEPQPAAKHFLDTMPQFQPVADTRGQKTAPEGTQTQSHQKKRSDTSHLPKLDIAGLSSDAPRRTIEQTRALEPEMTESVQDAIKPTDKNLDVAVPTVRFSEPVDFRARKWSIANHGVSQKAQLSKRELARLRALILTSGIKAMEIHRRAHEPRQPLSKGSLTKLEDGARSNIAGVPWVDIAKIASKNSLPSDQAIPAVDHYPMASKVLKNSIETSMEQWQASADQFTNHTRPKIEERIWCVRSRIADELSGMTGQAADFADETGKDLALGQLLKVKHVVDLTEKMMRNRRRRFRWVRRGMWSIVEWLLVGFMWYVWLVVTIFRLVLGVGHGIIGGVRWLLWL